MARRSRGRAAPNSAVGQINAHQEAIADKDYEKAAAVLAAASNKAITEETVRGLNGLLGVSVDDKALTEMVTTAQLRTGAAWSRACRSGGADLPISGRLRGFVSRSEGRDDYDGRSD